ncbi:MAG: hypothetical protein F6K16_32655 [Symploca sp. SIO2B6]|nr:hypothetical protein [Symploca sp. SIO2B6]
MDATWDEAPRSSQRDGSPDLPREDYKRDAYRAIPPSRRDSRDRTPDQPSSPSPSYSDEAPVVNANYANYRPSGTDGTTDDNEEDNSGYQNFY